MTNALAIVSCWKEVGIWGDRTCELLQKYTHCRNCERFHAAATEIFDRLSPETYHEVWKKRVAQPLEVSQKGGRSLVLFRVGEEWFALPTLLFSQIAGRRKIHSLPHRSPQSVALGVVNISGEILICVSLAKLMGLPEAEVAPERFLVLRYKNERIVLAADEVRAAEKFPERDFEPLPVTVAISPSPLTVHLLSWEGKNVGVIDEARLFEAVNRRLE